MGPKTPLRKRFSIANRFFGRLHTLRASDALVLKVALIVFAVYLGLFLIEKSTENMVQVPATGGTYTEGILGTPRFVNPVLAVTRADKDLTTLIFDGLMTLSEEGNLTPNIAESLTISEDGITYNVILRKDVKFHDGTPLTSRDVAFTVARIQDPGLSSPYRANFDGVIVEEVGEYEINFVLPEAYSPFVENLTFGILPSHIWKDAGTEEFPFSQHNSEPIGAGPYKIEKITRNASGIPQKYLLIANEVYHLGAPSIDRLELYFFPNKGALETAFSEGIVLGVSGVDPFELQDYGIQEAVHHLERIPLPRTIAVFFNQNKNTALRDASARKALNVAINRQTVIDAVLGGYGNELSSPVPPGFGLSVSHATDTPLGDIDSARAILEDGGWEFNLETSVWEKEIDDITTPLSFTIATVNNSAFETTAEELRKAWEALGVPVTIKQFEQTDLTQAIIRPRDYEALLFGTHLGRPLDFYSFWHSSQKDDPGLNISLYTNITTDALLSSMRKETNVEARIETAQEFVNELSLETPAIFLYAPELLYIFPNKIENAIFTGVGEPHERFMGVHRWFIEKDSVWPVFTE